MSSCLGLYIENNIIKYAKVSKEHDNIKVESFGIKFYDDIDSAVKQIINETYSYKTPISVNLLDEKYTYASLFSLLDKKDLKTAAATEFDYFCEENNKNRNAIEYKNIIVPNTENPDKVTSLYAYTDKSNIVGRLQVLDGYKVTDIIPLPICMANLEKFKEKTNSVIVNIEKNTSITFIVNGQVHRVETLEIGMKNVFDSIIQKENSYAKAYEICKNTTIYTSQGKNLQIEENEYMEDIMPVLYKILEETKEILTASGMNISNIYISGLATSINNIDLYFQEFFLDKKCEILLPFFIEKSNIKLNIKDYIEVNSAISLAMQGLGIGNKEINFKNRTAFEKVSQKLSMDVGAKKQKPATTKKQSDNKVSNAGDKIKNLLKSNSGKSLDIIEKNMIRFGVGILLLVIIYTTFSTIITNQIENKNTEILDYIKDTESKISSISNNTRLVNERKQQYDELVDKIEAENDKLMQSYARKNALPNFLTQIMYNIPKEVQLVRIENYTNKSVRIEARSKEYEQLGYFIAKIKNEGILTNVTATSGEKQNEFIVIAIEGQLPY